MHVFVCVLNACASLALPTNGRRRLTFNANVYTRALLYIVQPGLSVCVCVPSAGVLASRDSSVKVGGRDAHSGRHTLALFCFVLCITYNVLESNTGKHPSVPFFYFFFYNRLNFPRWLIPHSFLIFCPVQSSSVDPFFRLLLSFPYRLPFCYLSTPVSVFISFNALPLNHLR